ncbi:MAG: type IV pilus modification protein PilV [Gallionella sp.]
MVMNKQKSSTRKFARMQRSAQRGVALLEALVSVLLFSMGVLALVGLQSAMIKNTSDADFRAEASYLAQQWIGRMWADPNNLTAYLIPDSTNPNYDISADLPMGGRIVTQPDSTNFPNQYLVTIKWQQPGQLQHNYTTVVDIAGG